MKGPGWLTAVALGGDTEDHGVLDLAWRTRHSRRDDESPATVPDHVELTPSYVGVSL